MAFHLLQRDRKGGLQLAEALSQAMVEIGHCQECRTFTEQDVCHICSNPKRKENGQLCVVESPADIAALEATGQFSGRYFVLMGTYHRWMVLARAILASIRWIIACNAVISVR